MSTSPFYLYMIECDNGKFYTGTTNDIERRWEEHQSGGGCRYTRDHKPVKLVYVKEFQSIDIAREKEKQVKNWSQEKKRKLISGEWE